MAKIPGKGIQIGSNFSGRFRKPIDDRFTFDSIAEMASFPESALYDSIETYEVTSKKYYRWFSTNTVDATLGKWREVVDASSVEDKVNELSNQVVHRESSIPAASASNENLVYQYTGTNTASYTKDHYYQCKENGAVYEYVDVTPYYTTSEIDTKLEDYYTKDETDDLLDTKQDVIQYDSIPEGSAETVGKIIQYIGETTVVAPIYVKGHFYQSVFDDPDYIWEDVTNYYTKDEADSKFQEIIQFITLPVASEITEGKVFQYIGVTIPGDKRTGSFYQCQETSTDVYEWVELQPEVESIQVDTLPSPVASLENKIYQYIGESVVGGVQKGYFYICSESTETPGTYEWRQKNVQPSAEGGSTLERDITANVNVGGVTSGKTFLEGTSITDVLESILVKPVYQTVTLTLSEDLIQKIGTIISSIDMTASIVKGDSPITNAKYYVGASLVDTKDSTTDPGIINGGTYTYEYSTPFSTDTIFKVDVLAGDHTETATKKIQFVNPYYTGSSTTSTISDFTGLTEEIVVKNAKKEVTYGVTDNKYLVFAYDKSYGSLTSIKDENNFENIGSWNKSELTVDGQDYFVYITQLPVTIETTFKYTFII